MSNYPRPQHLTNVQYSFDMKEPRSGIPLEAIGASGCTSPSAALSSNRRSSTGGVWPGLQPTLKLQNSSVFSAASGHYPVSLSLSTPGIWRADVPPLVSSIQRRGSASTGCPSSHVSNQVPVYRPMNSRIPHRSPTASPRSPIFTAAARSDVQGPKPMISCADKEGASLTMMTPAQTDHIESPSFLQRTKDKLRQAQAILKRYQVKAEELNHTTESKHKMIGALRVRRDLLNCDIATIVQLVQTSRQQLDQQRLANKTLQRYIEQLTAEDGSKGNTSNDGGTGDTGSSPADKTFRRQADKSSNNNSYSGDHHLFQNGQAKGDRHTPKAEASRGKENNSTGRQPSPSVNNHDQNRRYRNRDHAISFGSPKQYKTRYGTEGFVYDPSKARTEWSRMHTGCYYRNSSYGSPIARSYNYQQEVHMGNHPDDRTEKIKHTPEKAFGTDWGKDALETKQLYKNISNNDEREKDPPKTATSAGNAARDNGAEASTYTHTNVYSSTDSSETMKFIIDISRDSTDTDLDDSVDTSQDNIDCSDDNFDTNEKVEENDNPDGTRDKPGTLSDSIKISCKENNNDNKEKRVNQSDKDLTGNNEPTKGVDQINEETIGDEIKSKKIIDSNDETKEQAKPAETPEDIMMKKNTDEDSRDATADMVKVKETQTVLQGNMEIKDPTENNTAIQNTIDEGLLTKRRIENVMNEDSREIIREPKYTTGTIMVSRDPAENTTQSNDTIENTIKIEDPTETNIINQNIIDESFVNKDEDENTTVTKTTIQNTMPTKTPDDNAMKIKRTAKDTMLMETKAINEHPMVTEDTKENTVGTKAATEDTLKEGTTEDYTANKKTAENTIAVKDTSEGTTTNYMTEDSLLYVTVTKDPTRNTLETNDTNDTSENTTVNKNPTGNTRVKKDSTENNMATINPIENTMVTINATENTMAIINATENTMVTMNAIENTMATIKTNKNNMATINPTENTMVTKNATENTMVTMNATEKTAATKNATKNTIELKDAPECTMLTKDPTEYTMMTHNTTEVTTLPTDTTKITMVKNDPIENAMLTKDKIDNTMLNKNTTQRSMKTKDTNENTVINDTRGDTMLMKHPDGSIDTQDTARDKTETKDTCDNHSVISGTTDDNISKKDTTENIIVDKIPAGDIMGIKETSDDYPVTIRKTDNNIVVNDTPDDKISTKNTLGDNIIMEDTIYNKSVNKYTNEDNATSENNIIIKNKTEDNTIIKDTIGYSTGTKDRTNNRDSEDTTQEYTKTNDTSENNTITNETSDEENRVTSDTVIKNTAGNDTVADVTSEDNVVNKDTTDDNTFAKTTTEDSIITKDTTKDNIVTSDKTDDKIATDTTKNNIAKNDTTDNKIATNDTNENKIAKKDTTEDNIIYKDTVIKNKPEDYTVNKDAYADKTATSDKYNIKGTTEDDTVTKEAHANSNRDKLDGNDIPNAAAGYAKIKSETLADSIKKIADSTLGNDAGETKPRTHTFEIESVADHVDFAGESGTATAHSIVEDTKRSSATAPLHGYTAAANTTDIIKISVVIDNNVGDNITNDQKNKMMPVPLHSDTDPAIGNNGAMKEHGTMGDIKENSEQPTDKASWSSRATVQGCSGQYSGNHTQNLLGYRGSRTTPPKKNY